MEALVNTSRPATAFRLAKGDLGIAQTVATMQQLIEAGARTPVVRQCAVEILRNAGAPPRDDMAEVSAVFEWMKREFRFTRDPEGHETLSPATFLLQLRAGDCDDFVVILGSLLKTLGCPVRIVTIAADTNEPERMSHVYLEARVRGQWLPLDATQRESYPGWSPPFAFRKKVWGDFKMGATRRERRTPGPLVRRRLAPGFGMGNYAYDPKVKGVSGLGISFGGFTSFFSKIGRPVATGLKSQTGQEIAKQFAGAAVSRLTFGKRPPPVSESEVTSEGQRQVIYGEGPLPLLATSPGAAQPFGFGGLSSNLLFLGILGLGGILLFRALSPARR